MLLNRNNIKSFVRPMGIPLIGEGAMMMLCAWPALHFHDGTIWQMVLSGLFTVLVGIMIIISVPKPKRQMEQRISYLLVSSLWIVMMFFATLPFLTTGATVSFTDACFEVMSGLTSTGSSVFGETEALPASVIFWRSVMQWIGGYGIVMLVLAVVPQLGINKYSLYTAEASGADNTGKSTPSMTNTIRQTLTVYVSITALFILIQCCMGMGIWDAINLTFAAVSSGGFSPYGDGIMRFPAAQQYMVALTMLCGGMNFTMLYQFFTLQWRKMKGKFDQLRAFLIMVTVAVCIVVCSLHWVGGHDWHTSLLWGVLQTVSACTTTGFTVADTELWWTPCLFLFLILPLCGAMAGSTSGGLKTMRVLILRRNVRMILRNRLHPHAVNPVRLNSQPVSTAMIDNVMVIFFVYLCSVIASTAALLLCDVGIKEAIGATVGCITGYGPGMGLCGGLGNYAFMSPAAHWILIFVMLMGRLECLTVLILFLPGFWRK